MRRYHIRRKEIKEIKNKLAFEIWVDGEFEVVENDLRVVLVDGIPAYFFYDNAYYPTVILLLQKTPEENYVTVDMGAVKHVLNGADIFAAGIIDADKNIHEDWAVYVRDEKYKKPLAIGIAQMDGEKMVMEKRGLAVKTIHYYGDKLCKILD